MYPRPLRPCRSRTAPQEQERLMTPRLRFCLTLLGTIVFGMTSGLSVHAQNYPSRPITFVVPFAPGGLTDVPARLVAALMQERIGQNIVVENKPGGSGVVGGTYAVRATPDGYTLLANSLADTQNLYYIPVPYSAVDDFAMIGLIVEGPPLVLIIDAKLPYKSLAELIFDAKVNPKKISFGTSGPATSPAISLTQLNSLAKTEIVGVPYRGSGEAARNVAGGAIQGTFAFYSQAKPLADDGKVRALAVASAERIAAWPSVPTMEELGYKNFDHRGFVGLAAPAKTPKPVIAFLNKHLNEVLQTEVFRQRMAALGMTAPTENTPEKFADFMRRRTARQAEFAKLSGYAPMSAPR
ncbi:MAG: tripartite tricarboxylate transporter substrate binding protein [Rhizobiales bacterium]|nr:tripartite tricarboxylate transporter substrate binding protein [Hyphomicrobiales bacterium]